MKVLHINVSAISDKFYLGFFDLLKNKGIQQAVFVPFSDKEYCAEEQNQVVNSYKSKDIKIKLLPIKNKADRFFYYKKINKYAEALKREFKVSGYELLHAHSLYSDGGVAYRIFKEFGIPYIVAIRSTDTGIFMKHFKWLDRYAKDILDNAAKVIFISPDLKNTTIELLYQEKEKEILWMDNCEIVPNGVNKFWLENRYKSRTLQNRNQVKILQVSRLNKGKNVDKSVLAIKELRDKGIDAYFYVAGSGKQENNIKELIRKNHLGKYVQLLGFVTDRNKLLDLYRECDIFLMPAVGETFGISYIEALTQGLPVIGVKGTGVGGYFEDKKVGFFIDKPLPGEIANGVERIIEDYELLSENSICQIEQFNWKKIINTYMELYKTAAESKV